MAGKHTGVQIRREGRISISQISRQMPMEACMPEDASGGKAVPDGQQKVCMLEYASRGKGGSVHTR
jgi:hypothetical protein